MPRKAVLGMIAAIAVTVICAWMVASASWLTPKLRGQETDSDKATSGGAQVLPVPDQRFNGVIGRKAK